MLGLKYVLGVLGALEGLFVPAVPVIKVGCDDDDDDGRCGWGKQNLPPWEWLPCHCEMLQAGESPCPGAGPGPDLQTLQLLRCYALPHCQHGGGEPEGWGNARSGTWGVGNSLGPAGGEMGGWVGINSSSNPTPL